MDQKQEGEYLQFKNIQTPKKPIAQSQRVNQKYNQLSKTEDSKPNNHIYVTPQKNTNSKAIASNKKPEQFDSKQKSPRSTCQIISFSTIATKAKKQIKTIGQIRLNEKINYSQNQGNQNMPQSRLIKAKSNLQIISNYKNILSSPKQLVNKEQKLIYTKKEDRHTQQNALKDQDQYFKLFQKIKNYETKIVRLQKEILIKNQRIQELKIQQLKNKKKQTQENSFLEPQAKYQHEQDRQGIRRLLKMLQMTDQYKHFAQISLDDNGVTFLNLINSKQKTKIDSQNNQSLKKRQKIHTCTCFKELIPQNYLWVPQSIYQYGKQFIKSKFDQNEVSPNLSRSQYELLLYELNKMWRERQKRVINTITHNKNLQIDKLKRKYHPFPNDKNSFSTSKIKNPFLIS